ncbi:MAG: hypothetical protein OEL57_00355 [Trichlorobacter sp.]|uniref:hypothetical protein n=1 Tax=Trichlorobacter sp. TaxID=2911007 RepID=UPI002567F77B|nr:hypothetical protein [Trichlorobacter sp.]MDK9716340.1 hypothetical protein [Trichlorobacter sp.]
MPRIYLFVLAFVSVISCGSLSFAADKIDYPAKIAAARAGIEELAVKVGNYPQALAEIEKARVSLKKAEQSYDKGRQWMGLGGLKPEAEQEIAHNLQMVDLALVLTGSRAAKGRNEEDAAAVDKQLTLVKDRVKLLEERKQSGDKLRQELQKCETSSKELTTLKADQTKLSAQLEQVTAEKKKLETQNAVLTDEKAALAAQIEALKKAASAPAAAVQTPTPPAAK